ncbi:hypothetical protein TKK_0002265 [Trichogramma kaykai]
MALCLVMPQITIRSIKNLQNAINWEDETERRTFLLKICPLLQEWKNQYLGDDVGNLIQPERINILLSDFTNCKKANENKNESGKG